MKSFVRSWVIAAVAAFALAGACTPSFAGIVYNVTNDLYNQYGWSLAGTITVSEYGTLTSASAIEAWDLTASKDSVNHRYSSLARTDLTGTLSATPTTLSLLVGTLELVESSDGYNSSIQWYMGSGVSYIANWDAQNLWSTGAFSPIVDGALILGTAAVPEIDPATGSSALSFVAGVLAMVEQRRRRAMFVA